MQTETNPFGLTAAEVQVMDMLCDCGETMQSVAARLGLATWTVNDHLKSVYDKLGVNRMVQACLKWDRWRRPGGQQAQGLQPAPIGAGRFARRPDGTWFEVSKVCADAPGVVTLYHGPAWPGGEQGALTVPSGD